MYSIAIQAQTTEELKKKIADLSALFFETKTTPVVGGEESEPKKRGRKPKSGLPFIGNTGEELEKGISTADEIPDELSEETPETEEEPLGVSYEDVKAATVAMARISRDTALGVLAKFNCKLATELRKEDWAAYIAEAKHTVNSPNDEDLA